MSDDLIFDLIKAFELPLSVRDVRERLTRARLLLRRIGEAAEVDQVVAEFIVSEAKKRSPKRNG
jgi:hypothetical protein